ncbi:phage tail protein [Escherichia coli]
MATKYYAVLTNVGAAKLANATALGAQVEITQMAVGDGNGALPTPNPAQTALVHELRRAPLNTLSIDPNNANQIIAEQVIPEDVGGWWIREIGLFDKDGDMIAVANCAETYKPQLQEGSGRVQVVRMILIVSSTTAVTLKIDPSVVLATRQYVDDQIIQVKSYIDKKMSDHVAAANPHDQYLQIAKSLKEIADLGDEAVAAVLTNLGLGSAAKKSVGTGANQIPDMNSFTSGYNWFQLPSGHIVQMFSMNVLGADVNGTSGNYPIAFPSTMLSVSALWSDGTATVAPTYKLMGNTTGRTTVTLKVSASSGTYGTMIIAVGR